MAHDVYDKLEEVLSREDLVDYINTLSEDFRNCPDDWEQGTLSDYFEAMAAWLESNMGGSVSVPEFESTTWKFIAKLLFIPKIYE
jgi:hypothetical protein